MEFALIFWTFTYAIGLALFSIAIFSFLLYDKFIIPLYLLSVVFAVCGIIVYLCFV